MLLSKIRLSSQPQGLKNVKDCSTQNHQLSLKNQLSADTVSFKGLTGSVMLKEFVKPANKVLELVRPQYIAMREATNILGKASSSKLVGMANQIIADYKPLESIVIIDKKPHLCQVHIQNFPAGNALCLDVGKGHEAKRYKITLNNKDKITEASMFSLLKPDENGFFSEPVSLINNQRLYSHVTSTISTLLKTLSGLSH